MSRTLYVKIEFVTLHQKKPGNIDEYLQVGGIETYVGRYDIIQGFGDPGEPPLRDVFDYPEFKISAATFQKPSNFSAESAYQSEGEIGTTSNHYRMWSAISVPDNFVIPIDIATYTPGFDFSFGLTTQYFGYNSATSEFSGPFKASKDDFLPIVTDAIEHGIRDVLEKKADALGIGALYKAAEKVESLGQALHATASGGMEFIEYVLDRRDSLDADTVLAMGDAYLSDEYAKLHNELLKNLGADAVELPGGLTITATFKGDSQIAFSVKYQDDHVEISAEATGGSVVFAGTDSNHVIGNEWQDIIFGNSGDDILEGGYRRDILDGGTGNDRLYAMTQADPAGSEVGDVLSGGAGDDEIYGSRGDDIIFDGAGVDIAKAGLGNDKLTVGDGTIGTAEVYDGGLGVDTIDFSKLNFLPGVTIDLGLEVWTFKTHADKMVGFENVVGSTGGEAIIGSIQSNNINGASGNDVIVGGLGNDILQGGLDKDTLSGGSGNDRLFAMTSQNVAGSTYGDKLAGDQGRDILYGSSGKDQILGGAGTDRLFGGGGNDLLTGGAGARDYFIYTKKTDSVGSGDLIYDFETRYDKIDLSHLSAKPFSFSGASTKFSASKTPEVRYTKNLKADKADVFVDINGDNRTDLHIRFDDYLNLGRDDFIL